MVKPIVPHFGTAVFSDQRYSRKSLEEEFDGVMNGTNGAALFGLRRIGKSTEAVACRDRLQLSRLPDRVIYQDAQGITSEAKLLLDILGQLPATGWRERLTKALADDNAISTTARNALAKFTNNEADVRAYFPQIADAVENTIDKNEDIVIIIDEFPWLCRGILESDTVSGRTRVDVLMAALRRWRAKGVRMLLMGSIGMAGLGRLHNLDLSHLIDLTRLEVPPLTIDEAREMIQGLALGGKIPDWTPEHTARLIDESAALYTSIIQRGFQQLTTGGRAARLENIADIFADKIRPNLDAAFYQQFDRRIQLYRVLPAPLPKILMDILTLVMSRGAPVDYNDIFELVGDAVDNADLGDALAMLREDGFLTMRAPRGANQLWRPASGLVTAWWEQRRGGKSK